MKRLICMSSVALAICLSPAFGQTSTDRTQGSGRDAPHQNHNVSKSEQIPQLWIFKASELVGKQVRNGKGEDLGTIQELAIDTQTGCVTYAVLSFGGFLGLGDKLFAIPWDALSLQPREAGDELIFVFDVDKDRLKSAPGFDKNAWPDLADARWNTSVNQYWQKESARPNRSKYRSQRDTEYTEGRGNEPVTKRIRKVKAELINRDVKNANFEDLGDIEDLMVDVINGHVLYAVIDFDDKANVMGANNEAPKDNYFVACWKSLTLKPDAKQGTTDCFVMNIPEGKLRGMPSFPKNNWPNMSDASWNRLVHEYYETPGFWATSRG